MSERDWRYYRERQRARGRGGRRERPQPRNAREAVEAMLTEELGKRGFSAALEVEAARAAETALESDVRKALRRRVIRSPHSGEARLGRKSRDRS